jgi:hypothetical protein
MPWLRLESGVVESRYSGTWYGTLDAFCILRSFHKVLTASAIVVSSIFVSILSHQSLFPLLQAAGPPVQLEPVDLSVKAPHSPAVVLQVPRYSPQLPTNGADLRLTYPGKL